MENNVSFNIPEYNWNDYNIDWLDEDNQLKYLRIFSTVCYSLFFCISLAGNSFLLWVLLKFKDLRRTSNLLLLHLTLSDLIFTLPLPIWAANANQSLVMGEVACGFLKAVWSLGLFSYMTFLMAITVHRYNAVLHALTTSVFKPFVHTVCIVLWLLCLLCTVPELVIQKNSYDVTNDSDTENQYFNRIDDYENLYCVQSYRLNHVSYLYNYIQIIIFFFLPFGVIVFCYLRMWLRIRQSRIARKNQTMKLIFLVVVGFFICWAPYNILLLLLLLRFHGLILHDAFIGAPAFLAHYTISNSLISLHCGFSPLVHIFGAQKFRERLPDCFRRLLVSITTQSARLQVMETLDTAQSSGQKHVQRNSTDQSVEFRNVGSVNDTLNVTE